MKSYLTISEFAALRNVNINSLRYYEKMKLLEPAYIDPQTKYRYYAPEQIIMLDCILVCIRLGMPLKNLKGYMDEKENLDLVRLIKDCQKILNERNAELQSYIEILNYASENISSEKEAQKRIYEQHIAKRYFIVEQIKDEALDLIKFENRVFNLFMLTLQNKMFPIPSSNIIVVREGNGRKIYAAVQVLRPNDGDNIFCVPEADFACERVDLPQIADIDSIINKFDKYKDNIIVLTDTGTDKLNYRELRVEIQVSKI